MKNFNRKKFYIKKRKNILIKESKSIIQKINYLKKKVKIN
jgi:hypothetical protein